MPYRPPSTRLCLDQDNQQEAPRCSGSRVPRGNPHPGGMEDRLREQLAEQQTDRLPSFSELEEPADRRRTRRRTKKEEKNRF